MNRFGKLIHDRRMQLDLTLEEVGNRVGVGKSTIRKWEQGTIQNVKRDKIVLLAQALQMDPAMLVMSDEEETVFNQATNLFRPMMKTVPIIGTIACGTPILAEENIQGEAHVAQHIAADFALWCKGDSMSPRFENGDLVFIRQQPSVDNGQIAAVLIDDEATLKHVYVSRGTLTLVADNPAYEPLVYTDPAVLQTIRIIGLVTGYQRAVNQ